MKTFSELTKSQKKFVIRAIEYFPALYSQKNLNADQLHEVYFKLKAERSSTQEKLGYPLWLQKTNRVGRGLYQMPWPTKDELESYSAVPAPVVDNTASKLQEILDSSDDFEVEYPSDGEFLDELRSHGITV